MLHDRQKEKMGAVRCSKVRPRWICVVDDDDDDDKMSVCVKQRKIMIDLSSYLQKIGRNN